MKKYYTEIVPFEFAVKLKDAGYPPFIRDGVYTEDGKYVDSEYLVFPFVSAPTYAEVFDWLMDRGINIYIRGCTVDVWDDRKLKEVYYSFDDTCGWDGLANKGIDAALELLKEETK